MKNCLKYSLLLLILATLLIPVSVLGQADRDQELFKNIQKEGVLKVGAASTPPKFYENKEGEWVGVFRDFFEDFAEELGVELKIIGSTWEYLIAGLKAGKYDVAPNLNQTVQRSMSIKYSTPTHNPEINFLYEKDNPKIPQKETYSLRELDKKGITAVVMSGSAQHHIIEQKTENMKILTVPSTSNCWMALEGGRADISIGWTPEAAQYVAKNPESAAIGWFSPQVAKTSSGIGVRRTVSEASLGVLNTFIMNTKLDGRMREWYNKYASFPPGYSLDRLLWSH